LDQLLIVIGSVVRAVKSHSSGKKPNFDPKPQKSRNDSSYQYRRRIFMDANKIDMFFIANGKKLPAEKAVLIREKMAQIDDSRYATISSVELKDPTTMLLVSIFLGGIGVDRFMMGETGMGILKLLTAGLCGILWLIDLIGITKKVKEYNYNELMKIL